MFMLALFFTVAAAMTITSCIKSKDIVYPAGNNPVILLSGTLELIDSAIQSGEPPWILSSSGGTVVQLCQVNEKKI
jgi:hypothetical protein